MTVSLSELTLYHFIEDISTRFSKNPALAMVGQRAVTYEEMAQKIHKLQQDLVARGVKKGEKIVLLGENSPNWGIVYLAITGMGSVVVPILSEFPESDINNIIIHSEAVGIFIEDKIYLALDLKAVERMKWVIALENLENLEGIEIRKPKKSPEKKIPSVPQEDDLAEILYTSGTTGHSKGVLLTHKNIVSNAFCGPRALGGIDPSWIMLNLLPLAHAYGSTTSFLGGLSQGASIYFLDRKPSPKILMETLQQVRPHLVTGVPLIFEKIFHKRVLPELSQRKTLRFIAKFNLGRKFLYRKIGQKVLNSFGGRLQSFIIGGASLNQEVEHFLREGNIPFAIGYGLSECSPLVSGNFWQSLKPGSVGRAVLDVQIKIDRAQSRTGVGEILVKGPNVMQGYFKNPAETRNVLGEDGWLRTGDLGYLDGEGYLFIKGRIKNVYVGPSGENIYPEIVEDKIRESMYIEESLVYVEDGKLTARVYLDYDYIQTILNAGKHDIQSREIDLILENVRKETNTRLPAFSQINKILEQPEPFVKTPTNKIKRMLYVPDNFRK